MMWQMEENRLQTCKSCFNNALLLSLVLLPLAGCASDGFDTRYRTVGSYSGPTKKMLKKGYYYIANKKGGVKIGKTKPYINTNLSSVTMEESMFLEDIEFQINSDANASGQKTASGRKIFTQNRLISQLLPFDRKDLMGELGLCRAANTSLMADIIDDGVVNASAGSQCVKNVRSFTRGKMKFTETAYTYLEDWHGDDFKDALYTFLQSCKAFKSGIKEVKSKTISIGTESDWRELCDIGSQYYKAGFAKGFFERYFSPFRVQDATAAKDNSKFTGYYIWELPISLERSDKYWYPIYALPPECKGTDKSKCPTRADVNAGALSGRGLELAWASNPMDVYFMQVQGTGIGVTEEGQSFRFSFAGKNNLPFVSYSEFLKNNPGFCPVTGYYNQIEWLNQHPSEALQATSVSPSFVFFTKKSGLDPALGSQGTPLVQSRSIAVDPEFIPYGVPMWIETHLPIVDMDNNDDDKWIDWNRLYIAQDTGSAIKGVVRADLYMGHGKKGEFIAKNQNFAGAWYMLIPNSLVERVR